MSFNERARTAFHSEKFPERAGHIVRIIDGDLGSKVEAAIRTFRDRRLDEQPETKVDRAMRLARTALATAEVAYTIHKFRARRRTR
jgi:hypothetical protein